MLSCVFFFEVDKNSFNFITTLFLALVGYLTCLFSIADGQNVSGLPKLGISTGGLIGFTDIRSVDYKPRLSNKFAYQVYLEKPIKKIFSIGLNFTTGKIYGSQTIQGIDLNFQTTVFSQSVRFGYNFFPFIKPKPGFNWYPYLGIGAGIITWRAKGDYKDSKGKYYADYDANQAIIKDNIFETDLRQANLDRFGRYPQIAFEVPVFWGFDARIYKGLNARVNAEYHIGFSDMLDNISSQGSGPRQGKNGYDNLLAISIGINYNLAFAESDESKPQDLDADGIADSKDQCDKTPAGVRVDNKGCPVDDNSNGISDYLEKGTKANQDFLNNQTAINSNSQSNKDGSFNPPDPSNASLKEELSNSTELNSREGSSQNNNKVLEKSTKLEVDSKIGSMVIDSILPIPGNSPNNYSDDKISMSKTENNLIYRKEGDEVENPVSSKELIRINKEESQIKEVDKKSATTSLVSDTLAFSPKDKDISYLYDLEGKEKSMLGAKDLDSSNSPNKKAKSMNGITAVNQSENSGEKEEQIIMDSFGKAISPSGNTTLFIDSTSSKSIFTEDAEKKLIFRPDSAVDREALDSLSYQNYLQNSGIITKNSIDPNRHLENHYAPKSGIDSLSFIGNEKSKNDLSLSKNTTSESLLSKSGIDLTDAKTAKAQFVKAAGGALVSSEIMSPVDLSGRLGRFAFADLNKNGKISVYEVSYFIDAFFEKTVGLNLKVEDLRDLIDFYFEQ